MTMAFTFGWRALKLQRDVVNRVLLSSSAIRGPLSSVVLHHEKRFLQRTAATTIRKSSMMGVVAAMLLGSYGSKQSNVQCEESAPSTFPLWPGGVNPVDIEELVVEIMNDPTVNLTLIPDVLERRIYKSTIQLTLNAFYMALGSIDGIPFLSHQIKVERATKGDAIQEKTKDYLADQTKNVNVKVLEEIADRLLTNPAINSQMLPDAIEKQIYVNCMVVIFRVLSVIVHSFRITICGHDIGLSLEPHQFESSAMNATMAHSSLSKIDIAQIKSFAESCGIPPEDDDGMAEGFSFWDRILNRRSFVVSLHTCMYSLVLGIIDDILANTKIRVMSDEITLDVVPADINLARPSKAQEEGHGPETAPVSPTEEATKSIGYLPIITFAAGVGIGATVSAAMASKR
jgi:hypothetical protein